MSRSLLSITLAPLMLAGCVGALVPIQSVETVGSGVAEAAAKMYIVSPEKASSMQLLGEVVGYSCKNKIWDPIATADAATFQARLVAAQRGAVAISNPSCQEADVSLNTNCWQSFTCKANAFR